MIVAVTGSIKHGKTLVLTALGYTEYLRGRKIYSNYWVSFPHTRISALDLTEDVDITNGVLLADEWQKDMDCRDSGSKFVRNSLRFLTDTGKRGVMVIFSSHILDYVDKRIRDNCDLHYVVDKDYDIVVRDDGSWYEVVYGFFIRKIDRYTGNEIEEYMPVSVAKLFFDMYRSYDLLLSRHISPNGSVSPLIAKAKPSPLKG